jgi:ATP-dependent DNA helicase DinG
MDLHDWFDPDGLLAQVIPGYEYRQGQVDLAQAMADALEGGEPLLAEAGTGIGKSASYLAALIASGKTALISTYTKALQDQLGDQDVPMFQRLRPDVTAAVLKGRRNYLCLLEYHEALRAQAQSDLGLFQSRGDESAFDRLRRWLRSDEGQAAQGDLDRLPFTLPEDVKAQVTVDGQSCVGRRCEYFKDCYSQKAKAAAEAAQVVIVNNRLMLLDLALAATTDGDASILPAKDVVVIDEAHHVEHVATESFGAELSAGRWRFLERRIGRLAAELIDRIQRQRQLGVEEPRGPAVEAVQRVASLAMAVRQEAEAWCDTLLEALGDRKSQELRHLLTQVISGEGEALAQRSRALGLAVWELGARIRAGRAEAETVEGDRWVKVGDAAGRLHRWLTAALEEDPAEDPLVVRYVEREDGRQRDRAVLYLRPIRVDGLLRELLWEPRQVLAVSATLATGGAAYGPREGVSRPSAVGRLSAPAPRAFDYWRSRVGVDGGLTRVIPSPFPFRTRVRLYVPKAGPVFDPSRPEYKGAEGLERYRTRLCGEIAALLRVRAGGAFVLFTSYAMLQYVWQRLLPVVQGRLFVQGELPHAELVRLFRQDGGAVLLGTRTFWEGIDVPGSALGLVIIDRLPFAAPDDPLWQAKVRAAGEAWFQELALPSTLMGLKQAFGRLMRRMDDRGVVAILDGRLRSKGYGRWLLAGLPPAPVIGTLAEVEAFCRGHGALR